ncbi:MAG: hypothetical protein M0Q45_06505 [Bacteroidales bacterium]|nr:hypothetical protein [Bacteroidales bacterium]MCK9499140.1 hypothetical protein [Bacteroidales bacterium]
MKSTKRWYIICTKPQKENEVYKELIFRELETKFFRQEKTIFTLNGKRKVLKPLISGYIFIKIFETDIYKHQYIKGISKFLKLENKFEFLNDEDIELLEKFCENDYQVNLCEKLRFGTKIEITKGIFKGQIGFIGKKSNDKLIYIETALQNINIGIYKEDLIFKILDK